MTKKYLLIEISIVACIIGNIACNDAELIKKKMEDAGVVPDVIDTAPPEKVNVDYPNGKTVNLGNELTPTEVKDEPVVTWKAEEDKYYVLAMVDPDAPSRENRSVSEVKHWLVGNIKGCKVSTGDVIAAYFGSGPPKDTGFHRYTFLVYQQKSKLSLEDEAKSGKTQLANRTLFSIKDFAKKYDLGAPIAGNFFNAKWEPYVDEFMKTWEDADQQQE